MVKVAQLLDDEKLLRQVAGEALKPGPCRHVVEGQIVGIYGHPTRCLKCGEEGKDNGLTCGGQGIEDCVVFSEFCPVPDPAPGSLADISELLVKKCDGVLLGDAMSKMWPGERWRGTYWYWIFKAALIERIVCCLVVLGKAEL